ncbi:MAG: Hsp70 family protein [Candidatus Promineifilaceae bacterium]|nr:Hsp70 family protein [Candidatus Promineifilaceae bacterium]
MIVGMDFGTTNSGMALYNGEAVRRLPLDPSSENPRVVRTALYITNEQDIFIGREAVDRYFEHNVGRPVKLEKVWVGEFEVYGADMYFVTDAYVWTDVMSPGRLFLSFKTNLRDHEYMGTVIGQFFYPIESLVALYLYTAKRRAEHILGRDLKEVVLGRPVHFADDPAHDRLAQARLLRGAFKAGYERVYLQREPIAAAYHYASMADSPQNILVFDFGGGTLDITIMRLGEGERQVLASGGVPIAGDVFDQKVVRSKLPKHFGEGTRYGPRALPTPRWIYDTFSSWQTILELQTPENRRVLEEIEQTAQRPREIRALINLVSENYGLQMFDTVEQTKRVLSDRFGGMIRLQGPSFDVMELITRREFEQIIRPDYLRIERELEETLAASGLAADAVDCVIRTGGSAEIPLFQQMLARKFGAAKVRSVDTFGSVTAGLSIIAHGIESGAIEPEAWTREMVEMETEATEDDISRPNVSMIDLELLKRRIQTQEKADADAEAGGATMLVLLTQENELLVLEPDDVGAPQQPPLPPLHHAFYARADETLLLITSRYRFLLVTPRQLLDMAALGQTLAQLHHFSAHEALFAAARWGPIKAQERLLLATSTGYTRAYPTEVLARAVEASVPLIFEQPLPGWPLLVQGARIEQALALITDHGRGLRLDVETLPLSGIQALNRDDDEQLVAACVARPAEPLLVVTANGYARRLPLAAVHRAEKANERGRVLISRRPVAAAAVAAETGALLTSTAVEPVEPTAIPLDAESTRSHRLLKPARGAQVLALLRADALSN